MDSVWRFLRYKKKKRLEGREMAQGLRAPCCFSRGPGFYSQHPYRGSELPMTTAPGGSDGLLCLQWALHSFDA